MSKYTTGEIAKLCGVTVRTVQYYDSRNILVPSALPMPLRVRAEVISGTLTALTLTAGGEAVKLEGMNLAAGQAVDYDAGSLIGDVMSLRIADSLGFAYVTRWGKLTATPGAALKVKAEGAEVKVTAILRGRWPD